MWGEGCRRAKDWRPGCEDTCRVSLRLVHPGLPTSFSCHVLNKCISGHSDIDKVGGRGSVHGSCSITHVAQRVHAARQCETRIRLLKGIWVSATRNHRSWYCRVPVPRIDRHRHRRSQRTVRVLERALNESVVGRTQQFGWHFFGSENENRCCKGRKVRHYMYVCAWLTLYNTHCPLS